jgi:Nuclease-related domain
VAQVATARAWQRYGHLRIYVSAGDAELGWCDPRTGRFRLHQPALAGDFWSAIQAECERLEQDGRLATAALPPAVIPAGSTAPGGAHWVVRDPRRDDLARNLPGESARARAKELRARHPLVVTAAQALGIRTVARSFAIGARGEREVGRKLNRWAARYGWHVLHAVPVGRAGADIDHVIIAPFGVVTVNTKTTRTRVWVGEYGMTVGGKSVDYLRKSRAEARRAQRLLTGATRIGLPVQPAIVFTGARRFQVRRGGPPDVAVLGSPRALRRWLRKQPAVLTPEQASAIYQAARNPATWQRRPNTG